MNIDESIEEINKRLANSKQNINQLKGFEIIAEALVYKIYDLFGKNLLLNALYQVGAGPGEIIAERLKSEHQKDEFDIIEALETLLLNLKEFYTVKVRSIERHGKKLRIEVENHCFLRESTKHRKKLQPGKAFCRVNKGYFETALKILIGDKVKKIEINFLEDDVENDVCIEELIFTLV